MDRGTGGIRRNIQDASQMATGVVVRGILSAAGTGSNEATMTMVTYYLLSTKQNPNAPRRDNGVQWWGYPTRHGGLSSVRCIGIHTTENDPSPATALNVARWQAFVASAPSSYHILVDSDNTVRTVLDEQVAFHIRGFNTPSLGLSFGTRASWWGRYPKWDEEALVRAAMQAREWCDSFDIPTRWITQVHALAGQKGFVRHSTMDPTRRSDPGSSFPHARFFELINERHQQEEIMASIEELRQVVRDERDSLVRERVNEAVRLGQAAAAGAVAAIRADVGLPPDPASDRVHVSRIRNGKYGIDEVRRRLEEAAAERL